MSELSTLKQQVANLTQRLNNITASARKIFQLPWQSTLIPGSKLQISNPDEISEFITVQQIIDAALSYRENQLIEANVSVLDNDITVDAGAQWVINNIDYELAADFTETIPYAETGYTRNDILVGDQSNLIYRVVGPETEGISPTPNVPLNTVLITTINVTDSTIGYVPPVIGPYDSDEILNVSDVSGETVSDGLNTLNTSKANDSNTVHKTGEVLTYSTDFDLLLSQDPSNLLIKKRDLQPESSRFDIALASIFGWGDSLTNGFGTTNYPTQLTTLYGYSVTDKGVGGETSTQIKNRLVADVANYSKSVIIWAGRNNFTSPTTVKADIATMISTIGHTRYLVVGILNANTEPINSTAWTQINALNADLKVLYGNKYVAMREYIVSQYNPSIPQDVTDHNNDVTPTSLRLDALHLNTAGYAKVAEFLNQRLGNMFDKNGYLQSKDFKYYFNSLSPITGTFITNVIPKANGASSLTSSTITDTGTGAGGLVSINNFIGGTVTRVLNAGDNNFGQTINVTGSASTSRLFNATTTNYNEDGFGSLSTLINGSLIGRAVVNKSTNQAGQFFGIRGAFIQQNTGNLGFTAGVSSENDGGGTGTTNNASIFHGSYNIDNTNTITNFNGVWILRTPLNNVTNARGFFIDDLSGTTISRAFDSGVMAGTGKHNIYARGTAPNYFLGNVGIGVTAPTAFLNLKAGTATASNAPLKFTAGVNLTTAEAGAVEFDGTNWYGSPTAGNRRTFAFLESPIFTGDPKAPTPAIGDKDTSIATTLFANDVVNKNYTVATLPTPTGTAFAVVTDALAPSYMVAVVGGGAVVTPVFYNGTNWVAH